jgi:galactose mutarotase-like enzyme
MPELKVFTAKYVDDGGYGRVVLEGPEGDQAIIALRAGSLEGLRFSYDHLDGPAEMVFPHESYAELCEKPTARGGAFLSMNGRTEDGVYNVIDPETKKVSWTMELPKNHPRDNPKDHLHGNARYADFELVELNGRCHLGAYATLRYVTPEPKSKFGMPAGVVYEITSSLNSHGLSERVVVRNNSKKIVPVCIGRHQSWLVPYLSAGKNTAIEDLCLQVDSQHTLDVNNPKDLNPTGGLVSLDGHPLDFSNMKKVGDIQLNDTFVLEGPAKRGAEIVNPDYGIGVGVMSRDPHIGHLTAWTKDMDPGRRELIAVQPWSRHSATGKYPAGLDQLSMYPDGAIDFMWKFEKITL